MTLVPIRDAATVLLIRDSTDGLEVFLQQRARGMSFAAGMTAFPGGAVDPADYDVHPGWVNHEWDWWAKQLEADHSKAAALVAAAIRETHEEAGVRLTADLLAPIANWTTPEGEPKRFNTRFFLAAMPADQIAETKTAESSRSYWQSPAAALDSWRSGHAILLPPTWAQLTALAVVATVDDALSAAYDLTPICPTFTPGATYPLSFPNNADYFAAVAHPEYGK